MTNSLTASGNNALQIWQDFCARVGVQPDLDRDVRFRCPSPICASKKGKAGWARFDSRTDGFGAFCHRCQAKRNDLLGLLGLGTPTGRTLTPEEVERIQRAQEAERQREQDEGRQVAQHWIDNSLPIKETAASRYFSNRGAEPQVGWGVRWLPAMLDTWHTPGAGILLWLLQHPPPSDRYPREWVSVGREALTGDGQHTDPRHRKFAKHLPMKGVVWVAERGSTPGDTLIVAEGQMDALLLSQKLDCPAVAACSVSNMARLDLDPRYTLLIYPDPDPRNPAKNQLLPSVSAQLLHKRHLERGGKPSHIFALSDTLDPADYINKLGENKCQPQTS